MEQTENTQLMITAQSLEGIQSAVSISNDGNSKATAYYNSTIKPIFEKPDGEVTDEEIDILKGFQTKCVATLSRMDSTRKPFTRMFDQAKTLFTTNEKQVSTLQVYANSKVTEVAMYRQKLIDEEKTKDLRKRAEQEEVIAIRAEFEKQFKSNTLLKISDRKTELYNQFAFSTLETIDAFADMCKTLINAKNYAIKPFLAKVSRGAEKYVYLNAETIKVIEENIRGNMNEDCYRDYVEAIRSYIKEELYPKIPAKREELKAIETASREELAAINKQQEERRKEELQAIANNMVEQLDAAQAEKELQVAAQTVELYTAQVVPEAPKQISGTKQEVRITVTSHAGWLEIIKYFWVQGGATMVPLADMEKKALSTMRTFAQKMAMEGNETINHPDVVYESILKTTRK